MTNKEGPGPAAFQLNIVPKQTSGQVFSKAMRALSNVKSETPAPCEYNLIQPLRMVSRRKPRILFGQAPRVLDLVMF